jgi:hypothetical protein
MAFALLVAARVAGAAPTVLVRVGDRSPLGLPFSRFSEPAVDDRGRIAFVGGSTVLFRRGAGGIQRIAGADDALLDHRLAGVSPAAVGPDGCVAFRAAFADGGAGVFLRCGDTTTLVVATGAVAPGGGTFAGIGTTSLRGAAGASSSRRRSATAARASSSPTAPAGSRTWCGRAASRLRAVRSRPSA